MLGVVSVGYQSSGDIVTDRLEFDVEFDLTTAERQAANFEKRFDKPIEIKFEIDQVELERKFQKLNKQIADSLKVTVDIEVDPAKAKAKVSQTEKSLPKVKVKTEVDEAQVLADLRLAIAAAEARTPEFEAKVRFDVEKDLLTAKLKAAVKGAETDTKLNLGSLIPDLGGSGGIGDGLSTVTAGVKQLGAAAGPAQTSVSGLTQAVGSSGSAGPIAAIALASAAYVGLGVAVAALPTIMFAASGAVTALGGALGAFGVQAAIELAPVRDALAGITRDGPGVAEVFGRELTALKGTFAEAFGPLLDTVGQAFEPLNKFLAGFLAGIAPAVNRLAETLLPVLDQLAASFAGPLGASLGNIIDQFGKLASNILPKLLDARLVGFFDAIGEAVSESGPGLEEFVNGLLDILDVLAQELPDLIELGNQLAPIFSTLANALFAFLQSVESALRPLALLVDLTDKVGDRFGLMGTAAGTARDEMTSTGGESKVLADALKRAGERAATFGADVDGLVKSITQIGEGELNQLPTKVLATADAISTLDDQFRAGAITSAELQNKLLLLRSETGLSDAAFTQSITAFNKYKTIVGEINEALTVSTPITTLAKDQQFLFRAALDDGILSATEFTSVMTTLNLSNEQTRDFFLQLTTAAFGFREALFGLLPTTKTAFDAIDLRSVVSGQKLAALVKELQAQQSDTAVFLSNLDKIATERPELASLIIGSGLSKQDQEALANEGAKGGKAILDGIEKQIIAVGVKDQALRDLSESIATKLGTELPVAFKKFLGGTDGVIPAAEIKIDDKATEKLTAVGGQLTELAARTSTVNLDAAGSLGIAISEANIALNALDERSIFVTISADDQITASLARINSALDQLDGRTVTVDLITNLVNNAREHGGPVWPGQPFQVNEAGTEGILDRLGFRRLPPGRRMMEFDRPGVIIPAHEVNRVAAIAGPTGRVTSPVVSSSSSTVTNSPTIIVQGAGHHPMVVARRVARFLP